MSVVALILAALTGAALYILSLYLTKIRRGVTGDLPGPAPRSFLLGNLPDLFQEQVGDADFRWQKQYGNVVPIKCTLGGNLLWVADPKALQHIYQTSGYNYPKWTERRALVRLHSGHGLVWADGDAHKRQRKVMLPAFGTPETKALFPIFNRAAEAVTLKWKDLLLSSPNGSVTLDISKWLSRATMDAIGEAAFDYKFGAIDDDNNELVRGYSNLLNMVFGFQTASKLLSLDLARFLPLRMIEWLQDNINSSGMLKARECAEISTTVAKQLLDTRMKSIQADEKGGRDVFSLLVRANASENEQTRLEDDVLLCEMRTVLFAGHETTSNELGMVLLELARNPSIQARLRQEIREMEKTIRSRGDIEFSPADMEAMPYTQAVIKETLRVHPVIPHGLRRPLEDDVLPLAKPIVTKSGQTLTELPITKGTRIVMSIAAYNRDPDLWGARPHDFDPDRWLDGRVKRSQTIGPYHNLLTFAGGVRSCIGWRFAVYEMQAFVVELVSHFEVSPARDTTRLRREPCGIMQPTLEGEVEKGSQLPLSISLADSD